MLVIYPATAITTPTMVTALSTLKIVGVYVGHVHTCAITDAGIVYCWGQNNSGQLGLGSAQGI
jgi:alpha-tubulin suppressor-like RCC1 family protein